MFCHKSCPVEFTLEEYLNKESSKKIDNYLDAKLPYKFSGMPNLIPIVFCFPFLPIIMTCSFGQGSHPHFCQCAMSDNSAPHIKHTRLMDSGKVSLPPRFMRRSVLPFPLAIVNYLGAGARGPIQIKEFD